MENTEIKTQQGVEKPVKSILENEREDNIENPWGMEKKEAEILAKPSFSEGTTGKLSKKDNGQEMSFEDYAGMRYYENMDFVSSDPITNPIGASAWTRKNKDLLEKEYNDWLSAKKSGKTINLHGMHGAPDNPKSRQDVLARGVVNVAGAGSNYVNGNGGGASAQTAGDKGGSVAGQSSGGGELMEPYPELPVFSFDENGKMKYETEVDPKLKDDNFGEDVSDPNAPVSESATEEAIRRVYKQKEEQSDREELARKISEGVKGYDDVISHIEAARKEVEPETEEQRKKRERRERARKIIGAVGDGISAMSNLYFTSQYAPHIEQDKNSQLKAVNDRVAALKEERKANADKYLNFSLRIGDLKNQRAATRREIEAAHEAQKIARQRMEREQNAEERRQNKE
ncbi:MAG: hypothetical protein K2L89_00030, partial [Muribaculaceae bacterium]|nr:hypothetical protein [Muribaculaceae bacterium]